VGVVTPCRKSANPEMGGYAKPRLSKKGIASWVGPW
jgi:hypothetical protein